MALAISVQLVILDSALVATATVSMTLSTRWGFRRLFGDPAGRWCARPQLVISVAALGATALAPLLAAIAELTRCKTSS